MVKININKRGGTLVAEAMLGKKKVGMIQAFLDGKVLSIITSEVNEAHRRRGLHNRMVLELLKNSENVEKVKVITAPESVLENWAREYGFNEIGNNKYGKVFVNSNPTELARRIKEKLRNLRNE